MIQKQKPTIEDLKVENERLHQKVQYQSDEIMRLYMLIVSIASGKNN
jgi:hypothetical protein